MNEPKTEQRCVFGTNSIDEKLNKLFAEGWRIVPGTVAAGQWPSKDIAVFCAVVERPISAK